MSKISNQSAYPAAAPALDDYLIGTDVSDSNATKTFTLGDITGLTPADTLEEVLTAGNTATNNIVLTGNITCTNIIPTNIVDNNGLTGTAGQHLVKSATNTLEWGAGAADTLEAVLTAGNTATNDINLTGDVNCTNLVASAGVTGTLVVGNTSVTTPLVRPNNIEDSIGSTGLAGQYLRFQPGGIVWETVGANTLQEVLDAGNTATQDIILTGSVTASNLEAVLNVNGSVFNATTSVTTPLMNATDIQDAAGATGTAGQYLTATGTGLLWQTVSPTTIPLADVLAAGNTAANAITLGGATGTLTCTNLVTGTIRDDLGFLGNAYQVLSKSAGNNLEWADVSGALLPLTQYRYFVGDASNQASESTLLTETAAGRVTATKFTTPDFECVGVGSTFVQEGMNPVGAGNLALGVDNLISANHTGTLILGSGNNALNVGGATDSVILGQGNLAAITGSVEDNYIIGEEVLQTETASSLSNIAIGKQVMRFTTGAPQKNVILGNLAVSTGAGTGGVEENVIIGTASAQGIATLNKKNVVLGFSALGDVTGTARDNVVIGSNALEGGTSKTSLTGSIVIGAADDTGATTAINNAIVLSNGAVNIPYGPTQTGVQDNETFIGNAATTYAQIEGRINFPLVGAAGGGFQDDAAAGAAGLTRGDVYMTDGTGAGPLAVAGILMIKQ